MSTKNATKTNITFSFDIDALYTELCDCTTKHQLVDAMNSYGLRTTTQPTDTPNKNDLYIQFNDKSRLLIGAKTLKLYTSESIATDDYFKSMHFDKVNDGSYRVARATVLKSVDAFKTIFNYFFNTVDGHELNYLPTQK